MRKVSTIESPTLATASVGHSLPGHPPTWRDDIPAAPGEKCIPFPRTRLQYTITTETLQHTFRGMSTASRNWRGKYPAEYLMIPATARAWVRHIWQCFLSFPKAPFPMSVRSHSRNFLTYYGTEPPHNRPWQYCASSLSNTKIENRKQQAYCQSIKNTVLLPRHQMW